MKTKQLLGFIIAAALLAASIFCPDFAGLEKAGVRTVFMLVAFLVMLISEAAPVVITSLLFCALMPLFGVTDGLGASLSGYAQPIVFFTLASFAIAAATTNIPLSKRILRALMRRFGRNINTALLALMICTAIVSSLVSNVPTCAIFMAVSLDFLELYEEDVNRNRSGRAFMIAIPVASMIGGMMTPAGSSINLLAIAQLENITGQSISFVAWMCAGIPLAVVMIPLAWFLIIRIYKPAPVESSHIRAFVESMNIPDRLIPKEKKVIVLIGLMLALWIASSWVPFLNVMVIAIIGCVILFLPGMEILEVDTFLKENSWDAFFLVGTVLSISSAMIKNGVSDAIASALPSMNTGTFVLLAFTALLIFVALIPIPVATSLIPIMAVPLVAIAENSGVSPALVLMAAALCACNCYLLPLDTVALITYSKGYYSMTDMAKSTWILQIAMTVLCALWLPIIGKLFGLA